MITYRTFILHLPRAPSGLLPECWTVEHQCARCRQRVEPDQLIEHARQHEKEVDVAT
jgi:DNA-binding transcriptional regulator PaaX